VTILYGDRIQAASWTTSTVTAGYTHDRTGPTWPPRMCLSAGRTGTFDPAGVVRAEPMLAS
jgi:hypothetical protein